MQSVANVLEDVFKSVGVFSKITASGRTDKGVHSSAQVISLEIPYFWKNLENLKVCLNAKLAPNLLLSIFGKLEMIFTQDLVQQGEDIAMC